MADGNSLLNGDVLIITFSNTTKRIKLYYYHHEIDFKEVKNLPVVKNIAQLQPIIFQFIEDFLRSRIEIAFEQSDNIFNTEKLSGNILFIVDSNITPLFKTEIEEFYLWMLDSLKNNEFHKIFVEKSFKNPETNKFEKNIDTLFADYHLSVSILEADNPSSFKTDQLFKSGKIDFKKFIFSQLVLNEVLQKSGLKSAMFGIETNNGESAKSIGKGLEFEKQVEFIKKIKKNEFKEILTHSAFILGFPKDTKNSMESLKEFLLSSNNPLDEWVCRPLSINPVTYSQHKKYFSEFDLNFEKYGYKIFNEDKSDIHRMKWSLDGKDFDYDYCLNFSNEINEKSENLPNMRFGAQLFARYSTILKEDEVRLMSRAEIKEKYDVGSLVKEYLINYYKKILSY
jgi:hypothetical protein